MRSRAVDSLRYICCPLCGGTLDGGDPGCYRCARCAQAFPVIRGIPDLRPRPPEPLGKDVTSVLSRFDHCSSEELIRGGLGAAGLPSDVEDLHLGYELLGEARGTERLERILRFAGDGVDPSGIALDIGCGMGGSTHALARRFQWTVGIDASLVKLIVAQKRCQEAGLGNVTLICASAEALPFADGAFPLINATDVVEHVSRQKLFLREGYRVLQPGGCFCFNAPNRFNIFGPEPHVNLWGVGFMPRRWMPAYVRLFKGMDYADKRLPSYRELRRMLRETPGSHYSILGTAIRRSSPRKGWKHRLAFRFPVLVTVANRWLKPFVPQYEVVVRKPK